MAIWRKKKVFLPSCLFDICRKEWYNQFLSAVISRLL